MSEMPICCCRNVLQTLDFRRQKYLSVATTYCEDTGLQTNEMSSEWVHESGDGTVVRPPAREDWQRPLCVVRTREYLCSTNVTTSKAALGTRRVPKRYQNGTINIYANQGWRCTSPTLSEHLCSTRSVGVFKRCPESVWKVHKRHAAVLRRCLQGTRLSITCVIIFHGLPPIDKRNFWLTCICLDRSSPVLS